MSEKTRYLTPAEIASQLRVTAKTVANWRYLEEPYGPPYTYVGGKVLYPSGLFDAWCEERDKEAVR